jgi:hypothetical protein
MVAKAVAMSKFRGDSNKNDIFFIFVHSSKEKISEYDEGENKDYIYSNFQI